MKKKGANRKPLPPPEAEMPAVDHKRLLHDHSLFFDRLVDLIPARFYVPVPDDEGKPWMHGLSKAAKAIAKKEVHENIKKSRRVRYDPEKLASTLDVLKRTIDHEKISEAEEGAGSDGGSGSDREAEVDDPRPVECEDRSITYEELRQRLHRRIEEFRANRNTRNHGKEKSEKKEKVKSNKRQSKKGGSAQLKRKRDDETGKDEHGADSKTRQNNKKTKVEDFSYGKVKLGGMDENNRRKRKLSKLQELEKAKKLEEAKKDPEKGNVVAKKHSWKAAMSRAVGEKVYDDPKLLQQSLKKEKKKHQKHAEKWKERVSSQIKVREEKQMTRTKNIKERIQQKKQRRIEKREKKLMRPGFEGRKSGYVNE